MYQFIKFIIIVLLFVVFTFQDSLVNDINSLSELPLDKLLKVKNTINQENQEKETKEAVEKNGFENDGPQALQSKIKKTFWSSESSSSGWLKKGGKKGLTTIFQISVTSLAFLAFGGYLLCLLVQAIKYKNATTGNFTIIYAREQRRRRETEETWPNTNPDDLYRALRMLSEGYASYYQTDYKNFNLTKLTFDDEL